MDIVLISLLTLLAAGVGTLSGFGTSTIMVPVLLSFFPLSQTLLLAGIVHWFGNIWKMLLFRQGIRWRLILGFGIPGIAAAAGGGLLATQLNEEVLARVLGAALIAYVVFLILNGRFRLPQSTAWALAGGALSGFLAGIFGIGGAVRGAFLAAYDLPKAVYIATSGAIGLAVDSGRLASYFSSGIALGERLCWGLLAFIPASFIGAKAAERLLERIPQEKFRLVVAVLLCAVGLKLLLAP